MNIEKTSSKKGLIKIHNFNYRFPCILGIILLLYAQGTLNQNFNFIFMIFVLLFLGATFAVFIRNYTLSKDFNRSFPVERPTFRLLFSDTEFSYGYDNRTKVIIPYCDVINYNIRKNMLFLQIGTAVFTIDTNIFCDEEISEIVNLLSSFEHIKKHRSTKSFLPIFKL